MNHIYELSFHSMRLKCLPQKQTGCGKKYPLKIFGNIFQQPKTARSIFTKFNVMQNVSMKWLDVKNFNFKIANCKMAELADLRRSCHWSVAASTTGTLCSTGALWSTLLRQKHSIRQKLRNNLLHTECKSAATQPGISYKNMLNLTW